MHIPEPPIVGELQYLSPSLYEATQSCKARAAWTAFGSHDDVPQHPQALLGTCVHSVVKDAHNGRLPPGGESRQVAAREAFDRRAQELYEGSHPLLRVKFPTQERIPYYNLFRERAALLARVAPVRPYASHRPPAEPRPGSQRLHSDMFETTLRSRDGLLIGRPDFIDVSAGEVVDYKTGAGPEEDPDGLRDAEVRQLRLYVYLAREVGINLRKGSVVRADGRRVSLEITEEDAAAEGQRAREALHAFNAEAVRGFAALATPSQTACRYCPCIPFCEAFWKSADATWADQCGTHIEGAVSGMSRAVMQNTALITIELTVARGTAAPGAAVVQQLPEKWACADSAPLPIVYDVIRVVNCRLADAANGLTVFLPDRLTTAVWTAGPAEAGDG